MNQTIKTISKNKVIFEDEITEISYRLQNRKQALLKVSHYIDGKKALKPTLLSNLDFTKRLAQLHLTTIRLFEFLAELNKSNEPWHQITLTLIFLVLFARIMPHYRFQNPLT